VEVSKILAVLPCIVILVTTCPVFAQDEVDMLKKLEDVAIIEQKVLWSSEFWQQGHIALALFPQALI
jgi:hypothetical protein